MKRKKNVQWEIFQNNFLVNILVVVLNLTRLNHFSALVLYIGIFWFEFCGLEYIFAGFLGEFLKSFAFNLNDWVEIDNFKVFEGKQEFFNDLIVFALLWKIRNIYKYAMSYIYINAYQLYLLYSKYIFKPLKNAFRFSKFSLYIHFYLK